jgi:hypothetical protein
MITSIFLNLIDQLGNLKKCTVRCSMLKYADPLKSIFSNFKNQTRDGNENIIHQLCQSFHWLNVSKDSYQIIV